MSDGSTQWSRPSESQLRLLMILAKEWSNGPPGWVDRVLVSPMDDGGQGSLRLVVPGEVLSERKFGSKAAEHQFTDSGGTVVLASLNLDQHGLPFELDIWRTDFSRSP